MAVLLPVVAAAGFFAPIYAGDFSVGDEISLYTNTFLWDGPGIDAKKIIVLLEPMDAKITGEKEETRYPVTVGIMDAYIDEAVLEKAVNGKAYYSDKEQEQLRKDIVAYAQRYLGNPYVWGGTSLTEGADCSGFVQTVFADHGIYLPRTSQEQAVFGKVIPLSEAREGDLILYEDENGDAYHVAIYIGNNRTVQSSNPTNGIVVEGTGGASYAVDVIS